MARRRVPKERDAPNVLSAGRIDLGSTAHHLDITIHSDDDEDNTDDDEDNTNNDENYDLGNPPAMSHCCKTPGCTVTATSASALGKHKCKGRIAAITAFVEQRKLEAARYARKRARLNEAGDFVEPGQVSTDHLSTFVTY